MINHGNSDQLDMRLTGALHKQNIRWQFDKLWKIRQTMKTPSLYKPDFIEKQGIKVVDPNESYKPKLERWQPPVPDDPRWTPEPTIKDHPFYHEDPIKAIFHDTKLQFGLRQACILAKTQIFEGLPNSVQSLIGQYPVDKQDDLMRRLIMQAHVWDSTYERLPKRFNPNLPRWKFKREWGIPKETIAKFLTRHILRMTMSLSAKYPDLMTSYAVTEEPIMETYISFKDDMIQIQATPMCLVSTKRELAPFGDEELLDRSCSHVFDDLWPVSPTIDLKKSHIYSLEESSGLKSNLLLGHPHTLILNNANDNIVTNAYDVRQMWTTDQRQARSLMFCLAMTTQRARLTYGNNVTTLPKPISMQCIHHDGVFFNFLYFQLNTLNLSSTDGVKNLAWIDSDNRMVEKIEPKRAMLRNTIYQNYDPAVYDKIRATLLNGALLNEASAIGDSEIRVQETQLAASSSS